MHMPGHKRSGRKFPYLKGFSDIDITEIEGFDNLHSATGILKRSMENAAQLAGADSAFYLVNGATCGILAVICARLKENDKVIVARNCHKSVFNGIALAGAKPIFVYPERSKKYGIDGSVKPEEIIKAIEENPDAKLIIITSPTYEGVVSDIKTVCDAAHKKGIPVLADAAHGAHFGFGNFPQSAVRLGTDASVESLHKTLPSLTQTAICYISGNLIDKNAVAEKLAVFETSSPSYILLASTDGCINALRSREKEIFGSWEDALDEFYGRIKGLKNIKILNNSENEFFMLDKSKIVLFPQKMSGAALAQKLRENGIEPEMTAPDYVICMTGAGDTKKSLKMLAKALIKIDKCETAEETAVSDIQNGAEIAEKDGGFCEITSAVGRISAGYVWAYPPEVPILVSGERISEDAVKKISQYKESGLTLYGDIKDGKILVVK